MAKGKCANCGKEVDSYEIIDYKTMEGVCCQECWKELQAKKKK